MITHLSTHAQRLNDSFSEWVNETWDYWYAAGRAGQEYTGRTFIGFHAWSRGRGGR